MVAASVIPPQERTSFHLFLLMHLHVDLKIELFLSHSLGNPSEDRQQIVDAIV